MSSRAHIVLVPGFAGFDALGEIQYYAGTTDVFRAWLNEGASRNAVLHYFDNLPSGAVKTRAKRLRKFLAKRVTRNEFQPGDIITLVGHSTGGLDIRQLIADLQKHKDEPLYVDGPAKAKTDEPSAASTHPPITSGQLLAQIKRVVFISTPHHGSNIADNLTRNWAVRFGTKLAIRAARLSLYGSRALPRFVIDRVGNRVRLDALLALLDAIRESEPRNFQGDADASADALEARSQLSLFVDHMVADFEVIDDLQTRRDLADGDWPSTIATCSFASISLPPASRKHDAPFDPVYFVLYHLAGRGRFEGEPPLVKWLSKDHALGDIATDDAASDGVVNTRSMYWKHGGPTTLVDADHGDIIGHYRLAEVAEGADREPPRGRRHHGYDFFKSGTRFSEARFRQLWKEIFDFCAEGRIAIRDQSPASSPSEAELRRTNATTMS
jgi:triacylglycerol lipase